MDIKRKIKQAANIIGIDELRKSQVKPINDILEGRDTMVVARPSAGKSAIYQIPALVHGEERTTVSYTHLDVYKRQPTAPCPPARLH